MYPFESDMTTKAMFGAGRGGRVGELAAGFGKKALLITYDEEFRTKMSASTRRWPKAARPQE
ncbi:MAG: hypothetical protein M0C28_37785 [Candidatus Moduliflexus flocculans]|nr:hypothetical protein [Candidatus Moduliflexus flocculans]